MNEKDLKIFESLIDKTSKLYDMYTLLSKLDDEKGSTSQLDLINDSNLLIEEIDVLLEENENNHSFIHGAKELIKQMNPNIINENIFFAFANKKTLILKRIYDSLVKIESSDPKSFISNLTGYFKLKAKENPNYNTYLCMTLPDFKLETILRTCEMLEETNLKEIKYNLAFLDENADYILKDEYYEKVPHLFEQNTNPDTVFYLEDDVKEKFRNVYGILLLEKTVNLYAKNKNKNEKVKTYLQIISRTASLFIDDKYLYEGLNNLEKVNSNLSSYIKENRQKDLEIANKFENEVCKETLDIIKKIIEISSSIKNIYNSLIALEEKEGINSKYYQSMLNYLKITLEEEKTLYEYFNMADGEIVPAYNYVLELINKKGFRLSDTPIALKDNEDELIMARISNKLYNLTLDNDIFFHDIIADTYEEAMATTEEDFAFIKYNIKTYDSIYSREVLRFALKEIDDNYYYKYNLAFLNNCIEGCLLNNSFVNMPLDFSDYVKNSYPNVSNSLVSNVNNDYALAMLSLFIDDIPAYDDEDIFGESEINFDDIALDNYEEKDIEEMENIENDEEIDNDDDTLDEELNSNEDKLFYNILIAELKACLLFADEKGIEKIREEILKREMQYHEGHTLIFKQINEIIDNYKILWQEVNKNSDIKKNKR